MPDDSSEWLLYAVLLIFLVPVGIGAALSLWALRSWLRAMSAGVPLDVFTVVGMKLKRVDADAVIDALALAMEEDLDICPIEVQRASRRGVDVRAAARACADARGRGENLTFREACLASK